MMFGGRRDQIRRVFVEAWRKHREGAALDPMERSIAAVIEAHPEYQPAMSDPDAIMRDYPSDTTEANPFLHMGMHITILEQITTDRPPGIRALYDRLRASYPDVHALEHAIMRCLAETLREGQERGELPDERRYLDRVRRLEGRVL